MLAILQASEASFGRDAGCKKELKGAGLFDGRLPQGFGVPQPSDALELREDEDPLETDAEELDLGEPQEEAAAEERERDPDLED